MTPLAALLAGRRGGVYRLSAQAAPDTLPTRVAAAGHAFVRIDLSCAREKTALIRAVANALSFPGWVGEGWDALQDAAADLSWLTPQGRVLLLDGAEVPSAAAPKDWATLLEVLSQAAEEWEAEEQPFLVLVHGGTSPRLPGAGP